MSSEQLKNSIRLAFAGSSYPGDRRLVRSFEGDEPVLLAREFAGKTDWRTLDVGFIDRAPDGFGTALGFFSDEALRFYLPAYLLASLDDALEQADPVFHLTHGLDDEGRGKRVNPRRYGDRTWYEEGRHRFSIFTTEQARVIVAYLERMAEEDGFARPTIRQALRNYWSDRAAGG